MIKHAPSLRKLDFQKFIKLIMSSVCIMWPKNWLFEPCLIYVQICNAIATAVQTYNIATGTVCTDSA